MRVLVTGDRNWDDPDAIFAALDELVPDFAQATLVHGDARGADRLAAAVAYSAGMEVESYPANWREYGRAAGPIRNRQMLDAAPDFVVAFHTNLDESKGTRDCVTEALGRLIPVYLHNGDALVRIK